MLLEAEVMELRPTPIPAAGSVLEIALEQGVVTSAGTAGRPPPR